MGHQLMVVVLSAALVAACGSSTSVDRVCELNEEFAVLNDRTIPDIEDDPFPEPEMLEENFVEGNDLMRQMVEVAPDEVRDDLSAYLTSMAKLSDLYAGFGYDREAVWASMDEETYVREYSFDEDGRARIHDWFVEHCGIDLQG